MRRIQSTPVIALLGLVAVVSPSYARSIQNFSVDIRKRNYMRLSTTACDECMTLEDFYDNHPLGFILFYERALMGGHKYKEAIVSGWMETCKELRWSRITCGMVDMVSDRAYAEKYIDPKTAPAHVVVRNGELVRAQKEQIDPLMKKPGDKATMLWHVADMLKEEGSMGSMTLSSQVNSKEAMQQLLRRHQVVVAAFTGEERQLADAFRAAVQEAVLTHGMETNIGGMPDPSVADSGRKGKGNKGKEKLRVAFVAAHGKALGAHFGADNNERSIGVFVSGKLQPVTIQINPNAKPGDSSILEAVKKVTMEVIRKPVEDGKKSEKTRGGEL